MKDLPQEHLFEGYRIKKSCRDAPIVFTFKCRQCPEYQECRHTWRVSEQLEDF